MRREKWFEIGNLPELLLPQTDLFGAHQDESWRG